MVIYLDASAIMRLVIANEWSGALSGYLAGHAEARLATSVIAPVEIRRSLARMAATDEQFAKSEEVLYEIDLVKMGTKVASLAMTLPGRTLRALDAIHVASAVDIGAVELVAYDRTLIGAARRAGLRVAAPGLPEKSPVPASG